MLPLITVRCEGSDLPARDIVRMNAGTCQVCGVTVSCRDDGDTMGRLGRPLSDQALAETCWPHDRNDVAAMLANR